jgi:hypothetical protein
MGIWRRARSFKFSEEESAMLLRVHEALTPMHETESQTIRWCVRMMHFLIFTRGMLAELAGMLQGIHCSNVYDDSVHTAPESRARRGRPVASGVRGPLRFSATTTRKRMWATERAWGTSYADFRPVCAGGQ